MLSEEQIILTANEAFDTRTDLDDETLVNKYGHGVYISRFLDFARAIEAEVQKQDVVLIGRLVEALSYCVEDSQTILAQHQQIYSERFRPHVLTSQEQVIDLAESALTAARARLGEKP